MTPGHLSLAVSLDAVPRNRDVPKLPDGMLGFGSTFDQGLYSIQ